MFTLTLCKNGKCLGEKLDPEQVLMSVDTHVWIVWDHRCPMHEGDSERVRLVPTEFLIENVE